MINKKRKPTPVKVTVRAIEETQLDITQTEPEQEEKSTVPVEQVTPAPTPVMNVEPPLTSQPSSKPKPLTMASLKAEVYELHKHVLDLTMQMVDFHMFRNKQV